MTAYNYSYSTQPLTYLDSVPHDNPYDSVSHYQPHYESAPTVPVVSTRINSLSQSYSSAPLPDDYSYYERSTTTLPTFQAETTHRSDYPAYQFSGSEVVGRPVDQYNYENVPFYGETTHRAEFGPKASAREEIFKPIDSSYDNSLPFYGETTHRAEFVPKGFTREENVRPVDTYNNDKIPFYGETTNRAVFTPKKSSREAPVTPAAINKGEPQAKLPFATDTTSKSDFSWKNVKRDPLAKPQQRSASAERLPIESQTTNRAVFTPKPFEKATNYKPQRDTLGPLPFSSDTTNRTVFSPKAIDRAKPYEPTGSKIFSSGPFDNNTVNRRAYNGAQLKCPIEELLNKGKLNGFEVVADKNGHKYFKKTTSPSVSVNYSTLQKPDALVKHHSAQDLTTVTSSDHPL